MAIQQILCTVLIAVATIVAVAQPVNVPNPVKARALSSGPSIDLLKPDKGLATSIVNGIGQISALLTMVGMTVNNVPSVVGVIPGEAEAGALHGDISGLTIRDVPDEAGALYGDIYGPPDDASQTVDIGEILDDAFDHLLGEGPSSTPTVPDEPPSKPPSKTSPQYSKLTIGCRAKGCDSVVKIYYDTMPTPTHSCPRDALAALAKWRLFCDRGNNKIFGKSTEPNCWSRAPSIDSCCGEWVQLDDPKYKDYPSRYVPVEKGFSDDTYVGTWVQELGDHGDRRIIKPGWHEYNVETDRCQFWRPEDDLEFAYFINSLQNYGIRDVDETGKIRGQEAYNAEGVSPGPLIPGSDSELDTFKNIKVD
ncbi:uncharacterized protein Z519_00877 [Cladophialophora bantiana CBS 173.52]|uniref:Uncharacterized protein n=1 Tax=Cladophialophora bantiana (strain ATCC 10958 / CBS 173.52 / CDC B-1940 / NIH 8579) TaxID=1442370 RepID=A0A0D2IR49_CLAB1|nr:uncharacterized protein Z519_00877 [Cladophialophora bantiana CBS 173.52]KIW99214.1 hypothetical protein Z519_00877 [Cladophialophora bantiana CBS 173.52]